MRSTSVPTTETATDRWTDQRGSLLLAGGEYATTGAAALDGLGPAPKAVQ